MMNAKTWVAASMLMVGALFTVGVDTQKVMPLRADLASSVPAKIEGLSAKDVEVPADEQAVAGMDDYLMRYYVDPANTTKDAYGFSVYVGYYRTQRQGNTIHSPKNCLPGAGWEALQASTVPVPTQGGPVLVNRYLLKRKDQSAVVLYWYQGRGRTEWNEYAVKWQLLRDAALHGRSDEALVRVIVPVTGTDEAATQTALKVAARVLPAVYRAVPEGV